MTLSSPAARRVLAGAGGLTAALLLVLGVFASNVREDAREVGRELDRQRLGRYQSDVQPGPPD